MLRMRNALAIGAGLCAIGTPALAQRNAQELETVTVIGTGLPTEVLHNPASITVISADEIEHRAPVSVATLLRDVPGVQISEEGIERIMIRGEEARRVAILIDGQRLTDHTSYGQPVLVDPTTIERIEVVRGSSSVVSGSSAIGGVINIITKRGAAAPFAGSVTAGYLSATRGHRLSANASGTVAAGPGALDYRLSFGRMRQGDRRTPDGTLTPSDVEDRNVSGHLGYRLDKHYVGLKVQSYDLAANIYITQPDFRISLPNRDLFKTTLFYEGTALTPWLSKLSLNLYRQTIDRVFLNDTTTRAGPARIRVLSDSADSQATSGFTARAEMRFSPSTRTVAGFDWEDDALVSDKDIRTSRTPPGTTTRSLRHDDASIRTLSLFGQHEMSLTRQWTATVGARWSRVSANLGDSRINGAASATRNSADSLVLGSAGLVWSPDRRTALRVNVSQGYIYPTLGQLFLTASGGGTTLIGNPDLRPERSTTYELGARYATGGTVLDATLFHSQAHDYIASVATGNLGTYQNVDAARAVGFELHAEQRLGAWGLTPYTTLVLARRQLRYGNGFDTYDGGSPSIAGRVGLRRDWNWNGTPASVDLFMRAEDHVRLRNGAGAVTGSAAGYATLNLRGSLAFKSGLSVVAELNNLGNRSYAPYGQMPGAERSINLFVTQKF